MTKPTKLEVEARTALSILNATEQDFWELDRCFPEKKAGVHGRRAIEKMKERIATAMECLRDGLGEARS